LPRPPAILFHATYRNRNRVGWIHLSSLKTLRLIHVDPDTIVLELFVQVLKSLEPHVSRIYIEPVNKDSNLWPYLIDQVVIVLGTVVKATLDKDVISVTHSIIFVAGIFGRNSGIDDR
jgi:hypothetical protein